MSASARSARELVLAHGWNYTAYQILNPGIEHWFSARVPAVVGYTRRARVLLAAGAPVCAPELLPRVCREFEGFARAEGCRVCYVCAEERMRRLLPAPTHATVALGAKPVWDPRHWRTRMQGDASLRHQLNRSRNKAVEVEAADPTGAAADSGLRAVLQEWLNARCLPPLHFLVEPDILGSVDAGRVLLVARRHGTAVAFLVASPIAARNGYLIEMLARSRSAPNGTVELLIDSAMRRFAEEGRAYLTLGPVALAHAAGGALRRNPFWLRSMMTFARAHANRFYNFRGLEHFRTKLAPHAWEPVYAISNEPRFSLRTLYAIGAAFSGISPWRAIGIGMAKALRAECHSLVGRSPSRYPE